MKEITYEEWIKNPTPRMMWVWNDLTKEVAQKLKVLYVFNEKANPFPVLAIHENGFCCTVFKHCAEIEEQKTKRMTKKELSRWLREKPTREYKYSNSISRSVYSSYTYDEYSEDQEVYKDIVVREDDGEWKEPLVEI